MIDADLFSGKMIESLAILAGESVGDILSKINGAEDLDPLIVFAFEEFYNKYYKTVKPGGLVGDDEQVPNDLEIMELCLQESVVILKGTKTDKERAIATRDVMDLRRAIRRLKEGEKPSGSK